MSDTRTVQAGTAATGQSVPATERLSRLGGGAGLFFAASVVVQNAVRGAAAPPADPTAADLAGYAAEAGTATALSTGLVALNVVALGLFVGAVVSRGWAVRPGLAAAGLFGAAGVFAMFSLTSALNVVVVARASDLDPAVLLGLWALHDAAFATTWAALGLALAALGLTGVAAGVAPRVFGWLAPAGGAVLVLAGTATYAAVQGAPVLVLASAGFALWLAFLVATGWRLVRGT